MIYGYDVKIGNKWYKAGEEVVSSPSAKPIEKEPIEEINEQKKRSGRPKKVEE